MQRTTWLLLAGLCLALATASVARAQTLADVFAGKVAPTTYTVAALPGTWLCFTANAHLISLDTVDEVASMAGGGPIAPLGLYLTQGQVTTIAETQYLVAYTIPHPPLNYVALFTFASDVDFSRLKALAPEDTLQLALLDVKDLDRLYAVHPVTGADLLKEAGSVQLAVAAVDIKKHQEGSLDQLRSLNSQLLGSYIYKHNGKLPTVMTIAALKGSNVFSYVTWTKPGSEEEYLVNPALAGKTIADAAATTTPIDKTLLDPVKLAAAGIPVIDAALNALKAQTVTFYEATAWPDGQRVVAFLDESTRLVTDAEWQKLKAANHLK
jgi:hypothetical protein